MTLKYITCACGFVTPADKPGRDLMKNHWENREHEGAKVLRGPPPATAVGMAGQSTLGVG